jgi:hypothetical protein
VLAGDDLGVCRQRARVLGVEEAGHRKWSFLETAAARPHRFPGRQERTRGQRSVESSTPAGGATDQVG